MPASGQQIDNKPEVVLTDFDFREIHSNVGQIISSKADVRYSPISVHMILFYIILVGSIIGLTPSGQSKRKRFVYVPIGIVGAFVGAFLSFGDAPFLINHPYLNPWTVAIIVSTLLVTIAWALEKTYFSVTLK